MSKTYALNGKMTTAADGAHCDGVGPQRYGTTFEVVTFNTNRDILSLVLANLSGSECHKCWKEVLLHYVKIKRFDVLDQTTLVDLETSIDSANHEIFKHAMLPLDPLHVQKKMSCALGANKATDLSLYD